MRFLILLSYVFGLIQLNNDKSNTLPPTYGCYSEVDITQIGNKIS